MEPLLIVMRSLPGAGKTTRAKKLIDFYGIEKYYLYLSADDYLQSGNTYCWHKNLLYQAHQRCKLLFNYGLEHQIPLIIIDNTNITWSEYKYYVLQAEQSNYKIQIENLFDAGLTNEQLQARCKHPVPLITYEKMRARYQQQSFTSVKEAEDHFSK